MSRDMVIAELVVAVATTKITRARRQNDAFLNNIRGMSCSAMTIVDKGEVISSANHFRRTVC